MCMGAVGDSWTLYIMHEGCSDEHSGGVSCDVYDGYTSSVKHT